MKDSKNLLPLIKLLEEKRVDNVQYLITWPFEELEQLITTYYQRIEIAEEEERKDTVTFLREKCSQVHEAITVKKGNEEQAWDYLT